MSKFEKFASIFVIVVSTLAIISFIILCINGEFEIRFLITTVFCIFLIITNVIDLKKRW